MSGSPVQNSLNTSDNIGVNVQPPGQRKDWDDMTEAEKAAARVEAQREITNANKPDPAKDREIDRVLDARMKAVFKDQKRHPVVLYQINGAMKAQGVKDLPPVQLGINGYNFLIPRGVPVDLPGDAIRILYQAGEVTPQVMLSLGLITLDEVKADLQAAAAVQQQIADKIRPMEM